MTNVLDCANSGFPVLSVIRTSYGDDFIEAYIAGWIINLQEFVNVKKNMTENQILETAYYICRDYYMLNIADIAKVFDRAKTGRYGELYDRLDGLVIMNWFRDYYDERCNSFEFASQAEASNYEDIGDVGVNQTISTLVNGRKI